MSDSIICQYCKKLEAELVALRGLVQMVADLNPEYDALHYEWFCQGCLAIGQDSLDVEHTEDCLVIAARALLMLDTERV